MASGYRKQGLLTRCEDKLLALVVAVVSVSSVDSMGYYASVLI